MAYSPYVKITGRFTVEVSALTGSGNIGNYNQVATAKIVVPDGNTYKVYDGASIITGNALKHWHAVYLAQEYVKLGGSLLNILCKHGGVGLRGYKYTVNKMDADSLKSASADNEQDAIIDLCNDLHGFLIPDKQLKRDSLIEVSHAIPVLTIDNVENVVKFAVQHNRVVPKQVTKGESEGMMVFKQEYVSGPLYGFAMSMDLGWVLRPRYEGNGSIINLPNNANVDEERKRRIRASILAVLNMLMGSGSKQARSLPISKLNDLLVVVSDAPIPNLVHGAYPDYVKQSITILETYASIVNEAKVHVHCYGISECKSSTVPKNMSVKVHDNLKDLFNDVIKEGEDMVTEHK
ncbi:type I-A CRISPR-associated protein Cas7/Csa2 [Vulcanisaeta souniana]|uniref:type I-A CRISPR-associated protein Cas7/Csa2 n=1 Tax=Vulcanisaeta souniana TaxID=164452 RepID=UPI000A74B829|nr:type I-A CRISPR-associated protein Cas7/Csa2 [Vulcanisaeta souniana]